MELNFLDAFGVQKRATNFNDFMMGVANYFYRRKEKATIRERIA